MIRRFLCAALALSLASGGAVAQQAPDNKPGHEAERKRFGFGELRPGADGNNPDAPNYANFDEAKAGDIPVPPMFENAAQQTPEGWDERRAELIKLVEDNWTGHIPDTVSQFRIVWNKSRIAQPRRDRTQEQWVGQILTPDGRMGPTIDATVTFPVSRAAAQSPAIIDYTYIWPPGFRMPAGAGPMPPSSEDTALAHGVIHVAYRPTLLQADNGAEMKDGVIGLARWPRERHDWGALRAWGWGASKLREELESDPRVARGRVMLTGHSRFGKGVLVAAAFDHQFSDAHVSSSGAGGAKIMRRDLGERWTNMAGDYAYHWYTPEVMEYAQQDTSVADLPLDAHMLLALRAPRPMFVTSGLPEKGDAWVDPRGMWIGTMLAEPAWKVFGLPVPNGEMPPAKGEDQAYYPLGWYQHGEGHVPWPAFDQFYKHEAMFNEVVAPN